MIFFLQMNCQMIVTFQAQWKKKKSHGVNLAMLHLLKCHHDSNRRYTSQFRKKRGSLLCNACVYVRVTLCGA